MGAPVVIRPSPVELGALSWQDVDQRLRSDCRILVPLGATEEHGYLSLATDSLFANHVGIGAATLADVLVAPTLPFGASAFAVKFPGTISLRTETMCRVVEDIIDSLYHQGFRRVIFLTGHGGNEVVTGVLSEAELDRPRLCIYYRNAWNALSKRAREIEQERGLPRSEHASWTEALAFTRVRPFTSSVVSEPSHQDFPAFPLNPRTARKYLPDGVVSGATDLGDEALMSELVEACIDELVEFLRSLPPTVPEE